MHYTIEVAGIGHENKDGTKRRDIVIKRLSRDFSDINVTLKRHGGNRHDRNAIGVYISKSGIFGFDEEMIGFIDADTAKEMSPMLKNGGVIISSKINRVWIPDYSKVAKPCVIIEIESSWSSGDIVEFNKNLSEKRKADRDRRLKEQLASDEVDSNKNHVYIEKSNLLIIKYVVAVIVLVLFFYFKG
ncbi:HIRAN domain-containing protein [Dickeya ananatis]|uniref:HIRAN domain-containing protein n=1 Tax=Dickeya ananatis TaxID=3061286 RepID=UPI00388E3488